MKPQRGESRPLSFVRLSGFDGTETIVSHPKGGAFAPEPEVQRPEFRVPQRLIVAGLSEPLRPKNAATQSGDKRG